MRDFVSSRLIWLALIMAAVLAGGLHAQNAGGVLNEPDASMESFALKYPVIRSRSMSIRYQIDATTRAHLARVELWYARGEQGGWQLYDYDRDQKSPMNFVSPGEGVYRFLVVAVDRWGRRSFRVGKNTESYQNSSPIPPDHVQAQQVVFVDFTAPKLYLYSPRSALKNYRRDRLMVRWQGFDTYLESRPLRLYFNQPGSEEWTSISPPLPTGGQFEWKVPDHLVGKVRIRAVLTDVAGNVDVQTSGLVYLARKEDSSRKGEPLLSDAEKPFKYEFLDPAISNSALGYASVPTDLSSQGRRMQSQRAFRRGKLNSQRKEWTLAIKAYQETLAIDPSALEAKVNLANTYFRTGEFENALQYYEMVLQQDSSRNNALFGLAQTQRALNQHSKALVTLELLLKQDREDYQAWRMHAEAAEKTGQFELAKTSWQQAQQSPFHTIRQLAQERLGQMN